MPLDRYEWIDRRELLTFEEITRLAGIFVRLGVEKIRLTGGEPLLRRDLDRLVSNLSALSKLRDLCLTTNGSLLSEQIEPLARAGLKRINVSIDTLDPEKFQRMTRRNDLTKVLDGLFAAQRLGLKRIKINAVVERGVNDDDILPLVEFARGHGFALRFIEFMDVGNANNWQTERTVSKKEILAIIRSRYELHEAGRDSASAPAVEYRLADGSGEIGIIASITEPFCTGCTRARLTADGKLVTCLFSDHGHDLKSLLRGGSADSQIEEFVRGIWTQRTDRYSEERLEAMSSPQGYQPKRHKKIEMIHLGG